MCIKCKEIEVKKCVKKKCKEIEVKKCVQNVKEIEVNTLMKHRTINVATFVRLVSNTYKGQLNCLRP